MSVYKINNINLDNPQFDWVLEQATKLPAPASRRVASLDLPYVDGVKPVRQGVGTGTMSISVAVLGETPQETDHNHAVLKSLLLDAATVSYQPDGGKTRTVTVVDCALAEPAYKDEISLVQAAVLRVQPFWQEGARVVSAAQPLAGTVTFSEFAGCTGVLQDAIVRVLGPFGECTVTSPADGSGVVFPTPVAAGSYAYVRLSDWHSWVNTDASSWSKYQAGYAPDWPGPGPLRIQPTLDGSAAGTKVQLHVEATNTTDASKIQVWSSRWYL